VTLPLAAPGIIASAIFVFLESLDEFTGTFFVGVPNVSTLAACCSTAPAWAATTRSPRSRR
jgi:ABC-type spermidine/putrescine transport system permease subunit II